MLRTTLCMVCWFWCQIHSSSACDMTGEWDNYTHASYILRICITPCIHHIIHHNMAYIHTNIHSYHHNIHTYPHSIQTNKRTRYMRASDAYAHGRGLVWMDCGWRILLHSLLACMQVQGIDSSLSEGAPVLLAFCVSLCAEPLHGGFLACAAAPHTQ